MVEVYETGRLLMGIMGPLALVCLLTMFALVWKDRGKLPKMRAVLYLYSKASMEKKGHAGVLAYLFMASGLMFMVSLAAALIGTIFK